MFTKNQLKEQKFNDEQWQEYEAKICKNCHYYLSDYDNCQGQKEICFEFKNKLDGCVK